MEDIADWSRALEHLRDLGLAYVLALPIAWDREVAERSAGLRTFPLVAVAACAYMLTGYEVLATSEAHARVMEGLLAGIGFIGGGAILKDSGSVKGTATAASLWGTGAIGLAVASGHVEIALIVSLVTFLTLRLRFLKPLILNGREHSRDTSDTTDDRSGPSERDDRPG